MAVAILAFRKPTVSCLPGCEVSAPPSPSAVLWPILRIKRSSRNVAGTLVGDHAVVGEQQLSQCERDVLHVRLEHTGEMTKGWMPMVENSFEHRGSTIKLMNVARVVLSEPCCGPAEVKF